MKKNILFLLFSIAIQYASYSNDIYTGIAEVICDCLQKSETKPDNIADNTVYKTCIIANIKPYKKELKRIVKKSFKQEIDEDTIEEDALEKFNKELDIALNKKCPELSKSMIDKLNLFSE